MRCFAVRGKHVCTRRATMYAEEGGVVFPVCDDHAAVLTNGGTPALVEKLRFMPDHPAKQFDRIKQQK